MKVKSLKEINQADLLKSLNEKKEELHSFYFGSKISKNKSVANFSKTRKEIARILTELNLRVK